MSTFTETLSSALSDLCPVRVIYLETVDSTNRLARDMAAEIEEDVALVIADSQSHGRGRRGNRWHSPKGNLYMSILLKSALPQDIQHRVLNLLTPMAGLAVVDSVEQIFRYPLFLKWPNDIMAEDKKIGGILTELRHRPGRSLEIVIGIGFNIVSTSMPNELLDKAVSLSELIYRPISREELAASITRHVVMGFRGLATGHTEGVLTGWRAKNSTIGRMVRVVNDSGSFIGMARAIDDMGRLIIDTALGGTVAVDSGSLFYV